MGQQISHCKTGNEPSNGSFEPHIVECRKRRLPGIAPKSLLQHFHHHHDDNTAMSRTTASTCTGQTSANSKSTSSSFSPPSPLGSSSGTLGGKNNSNSNRNSNGNVNTVQTRPNLLRLPTKDMLHQQDQAQDEEPLLLRYTTSTRNLSKEATATTASKAKKTATTISTDNDPDSRPVLRQQQQQEEKQQEDTRCQRGRRNHNHRRKGQCQSFQGKSQGSDKRSNPVKFPRKRYTSYGRPARNPEQQRNGAVSAHAHPAANNGSPQYPNNETPQQGASYLERMYDARTWDMYRRITTHREKVEAFNAANVSAKEQRQNDHDDDRNSTNNQTYMSDPVQRVTNSTAMVGGVDYDNFYDPSTELDDDDSRGGGNFFLLEDRSAPPYHHHRQCDNGQNHHQSGIYCHNPGGNRHNHNSSNHSSSNHHHHHNSNTETYSEWEHMYGDDVEAVGDPVNDSINAHGGHHETIFLFDF